MRRIILPVSLTATVLLIALGTHFSGSVSAGQGKGGEVVAKPTLTPKKTTTRRNTPARTTNNSKTNQTTKSAAEAASAAEMTFWNSIKDSTNPEEFRAYLEQYPKGKFVTLAKNRLKTLEAAKPKPSATPNTANETTQGNRTSTNLTSSNMPHMRTNQAGIGFMLIQPGSFMMGSTNGDDEKPVHQRNE